MKIIDSVMLDRLSAAARELPRRRQNLNLHDSYQDPCQRLLNAVEPDSYVRPHRHLMPPKPELFLVLRGRFAAIVFREGGEIERTVILEAASAAVGVEIPAGAWHAVVALDKGSIFFEAKPGPYEMISDKEWAPWAPPEGDERVGDYLENLKKAISRFLREDPETLT
jgi:cupin fold WbuC family metalloprotein